MRTYRVIGTAKRPFIYKGLMFNCDSNINLTLEEKDFNVFRDSINIYSIVLIDYTINKTDKGVYNARKRIRDKKSNKKKI